MGLKDQVIALKWIYENIERFGGDKKQITLFGHSSGIFYFSSEIFQSNSVEIRNLGAMSTHLHMIHPETKHLFQRAIFLHGTALSSIFPILNNHTTIIQDFGT